jgi:hypothetical protein
LIINSRTEALLANIPVQTAKMESITTAPRLEVQKVKSRNTCAGKTGKRRIEKPLSRLEAEET